MGAICSTIEAWLEAGLDKVVGHDEFRVNAGFNRKAQDEALPSDPFERKRVRDEYKKKLQILKNTVTKLEEIMEEDENMAETGAKLKDFMNSKDGRDLRNLLEHQPTVNRSLAWADDERP